MLSANVWPECIGFYDAVKEIDFHSVLDGFGGTASVSYLLKTLGKEVSYNDYLKFNSIIAKSIIENSCHTLSDEELNDILSHKTQTSSFISNNFQDVYYLSDENLWLDTLIIKAQGVDLESNNHREYTKSILYNALFQACLIKRPFNLFHRANLNLRTSNVERSFGNKFSWEKDFNFYLRKFTSEINNSIIDTGVNCKVYNKDILDMELNDFDLVYLDPPYLQNKPKNESANYLKMYHFLEGISNYQNWEKIIDFDSKNNNILDNYLPNHFKVSNVQETMEQLVYKFRRSKIIISYKYGGIPSIDYLIELLKKMNKKVSYKSLHYKYALNRQNGNAKLNREYLIIGL